MRVALAGIWHETNVFAPDETTIENFRVYQYFTGPELTDGLSGTGTELGGALAAARELGVEAVPLTFAAALPSGVVRAEDFERILAQILEQARTQLPVDAAVLALHGAMVVQGRTDPEADIVQAVRGVIGDVPIAVTLDYHANVSDRLASLADLICGYRTYPHVDMAQRGADALALVVRAVRRGRRPAARLVRLPLLTVPIAQESALEPMSSILAMIEAAAGERDVWTACALPGFAYSDGDRLGFSVYVAADEHAGPTAVEIATQAWARRAEFSPEVMDADQAVRLATQGSGPTVLVDVADNVGGGSPGDSTHLLHALRRNRARGSITVMWDPALVRQAHDDPAGSADLCVGGHSDPSMGPAFRLGVPAVLHGPVTYARGSSYMTGSTVDMGRVAVFHADVGSVVVTENRVVPFDREHVTVLGLEPERAPILVAKGAIAWKAAFGEIAQRACFVKGPGACPVDLREIDFRWRPTPMYPLEGGTTWPAPESSTRLEWDR